MKRKICFITGTRAEYGLIAPLMKEIKKSKDMVLQLIVTGMHLSPEFGLTYRAIEKDGFVINSKSNKKGPQDIMPIHNNKYFIGYNRNTANTQGYTNENC